MSRISKFSTDCIRGGSHLDPAYGAILPPIYQTTTFRYAKVGEDQEFSYSRVGNPTVKALEDRLGTLEGVPTALCFSSGMAATATLCLALLKAGDRVVCSEVVYGGTFRFLKDVLANFGVHSDFVDTSQPSALAAALKEPTRLVLLETPANPTLKLTDIEACASIAHEHGALVAVDNTFLTPVLQRPLDLGADLALYSTTKYVDGHNAAVGGAICTRDEQLHERIAFLRKAQGTIQSAHNAWLTLQGVKTLALRLERHGTNALEVAEKLERNPLVSRVHYPGLSSFPQRELARQQQLNGGGVVSIEVSGGLREASAVMGNLKLVTPAEHLGAIESLATHPATMTHQSVPDEVCEQLGIGDGLIRLSVGLENPEEIVADVEQALIAARSEVQYV